MRPLRTGAMTFGLVNTSVELHSAVEGKERVSFRLIHKKDCSPIRYERVCQKKRVALEWNEIVKGYECITDKFIVLTDDDRMACLRQSSIRWNNRSAPANPRATRGTAKRVARRNTA